MCRNLNVPLSNLTIDIQIKYIHNLYESLIISDLHEYTPASASFSTLNTCAINYVH